MSQSIKHSDAIINTINELWAKKGWNSVYAYLKYANIKHKVSLVEFGLDTNGTARTEQAEYINSAPKNAFRARFSNRQVTSRTTKWSYNILRAQEIQLL